LPWEIVSSRFPAGREVEARILPPTTFGESLFMSAAERREAGAAPFGFKGAVFHANVDSKAKLHFIRSETWPCGMHHALNRDIAIATEAAFSR
jgi:hypothetical protein